MLEVEESDAGYEAENFEIEIYEIKEEEGIQELYRIEKPEEILQLFDITTDETVEEVPQSFREGRSYFVE